MPRMDGHQTLAGIKEDPELHDIPVIILTTSNTEVDRPKAHKSNASSYLAKPLSSEHFNQMLRHANHYRAGGNASLFVD